MKLRNLLNKPNAALVMLPRIGKLTPVGRKLYNSVLKRTYLLVMALKAQGMVMNAEHLFEAPLNELTDSVNAEDSKSNPRGFAKKYLREMRRIEVDWESPDANTGVVWQSMGLLSEAQVEIRGGVNWALWALPPSLLAALVDPDRFTILDLDQVAKLNSYCAIALFEICSRYRDNPTHLTSRNPTDWWTDALSNTPPAFDKVTGEYTRREWRKFKSEFVNKAIEEINTKTDITIGLVKLGQGVKQAQFTVQKKQLPAFDIPKIRSDVAELAASLDVSLEFIAKLVSEGAGDSELKIALHKLDGRTRATGMEVIENRSAYLRKILNEGQGARAKFEIVQARPVEGKVPLELARSPTDHRRAQMQAEFLALTKEDQRQWANAAADSLRVGKILTPNLARKVQNGEWGTGLILSMAAEAYGVGTYGVDWLMMDIDQEIK
jgi:hypothetical protein